MDQRWSVCQISSFTRCAHTYMRGFVELVFPQFRIGAQDRKVWFTRDQQKKLDPRRVSGCNGLVLGTLGLCRHATQQPTEQQWGRRSKMDDRQWYCL
jgi:hypothetical protein